MSALARGDPVPQPVPQEIIKFLLMKEFPGLTPRAIDEMNAKEINMLVTMVSVYNRVQNAKYKKGK